MKNMPNAYRLSTEEVLEHLKVAPLAGLSGVEARARFEEHGPNQLREAKPRSAWSILFGQFKSLVVLLLAGAAAAASALGDYTEGFAVVAVIVINAAIGFITEIKATRSMDALLKMGDMLTRVRRDGHVFEAPAAELVPGDVVIIEGGDIVTADLRIVDASKLECDESSLTGESIPVSKDAKAIGEDHPLAERHNMLYKGTAVTRGSGTAVVVGTGMHTELGTISTLVEETGEQSTPLEKHLDKLGHNLVWIILAITAVVWVLGVLRGKPVLLMFETAIALAVASIPEGLSIVATIALSRGMLRMARRQALVRRLASVETLGGTSVICTDKTGTLTENKMTVERVELPSGIYVRRAGTWAAEQGEPVSWSENTDLYEAFRIGVFCNNAALARGEDGADTGDPTEIALLVAGREAGIDQGSLVAEMPEVREDAFDSVTKIMATANQDKDGFFVAIKGAAESVIGPCGRILKGGRIEPLKDEDRAFWLQRNEDLAVDGFRVLAVALNRIAAPDDDLYRDSVFVGLLGLIDPPRSDIRETIERCKRAGIRVIMITGDQPATALNVGRAVGLLEEGKDRVMHGDDLKPPSEFGPGEEEAVRQANVFARVSPKQKLDLIALHQKHNAIVAMTGDGVNDAPALKKADIGIAMGLRGTQVAQQAAHVVLKDDSFKTIVYAIQEGRVIFANIRSFVAYLLSCNIGEILVIFLASVLNTNLPILPLQILLLNLVTDVFPALALGVGEGNDEVMNHRPRPKGEPIVTRALWGWITFHGTVLGLCTLGAFAVAATLLNADQTTTVTISFMTLAFGQLFHVFNMREAGAGLFGSVVTRNPYVWAALALCVVVLASVVYVPSLAAILGTTALGLSPWGVVLAFSALPVLADWMARRVVRAE